MNSSTDNTGLPDHGIDANGYRANVGMIICDDQQRVFWARRAGQSGWQFPQGGVAHKEEPIQAMYRELLEEVGLEQEHVELLGHTDDWLKYKLPQRFRRRSEGVECIGQKQMWYLLKFHGSEELIKFDMQEDPEFDKFRWVNYWYPVNHVIYFKRHVYKRALNELQCFL